MNRNLTKSTTDLEAWIFSTGAASLGEQRSVCREDTHRENVCLCLRDEI